MCVSRVVEQTIVISMSVMSLSVCLSDHLSQKTHVNVNVNVNVNQLFLVWLK